MDNWHILVEVLLLLTGALLLGTIAERFRQSAIIGFLLAGTLAGPNGLGFVKSSSHLQVIGELGVALLLFTIGLEFSINRLRRLGKAALFGGVAQVIVTSGLVFLIARLFGSSPRAAITLGAAIALSSTATVLRLLTDGVSLERPYGRLTLGILLVQDVAVFPLALIVSALSREGGTAGEIVWDLTRTVIAAAIMIATFLFFFNSIVPRLLNIREWSLNREFPVLLAIIMALGSAAVAHLAGISPAIGAFLAGVLLGESIFAAQIRADVAAFRAVLVTFFFASVGILFEPRWAVEHWQTVLGVSLAVIVGKAVVIWIILKLLRARHDTSLAAGLCLAQVGEFAFVLVGIAQDTIFEPDAVRLIVSVTIMTLFVAPVLVYHAPALAARLVSATPLRRSAAGPVTKSPDAPKSGEAKNHIVLVGFGPAAQQLLEAVPADNRPPITVIDLNPRAAEMAEKLGVQLHIGHAGHPDVLEEANLESASTVVITIPDPITAIHVIQQCRLLHPDVRIVARARYHMYCSDLREAGADEVVDEEHTVGLALARAVFGGSVTA